MPVALILGPFVPGFFVTVIALYAIIKIILIKESRYILKDYAVFLIILFNLYLIISSFISKDII